MQEKAVHYTSSFTARSLTDDLMKKQSFLIFFLSISLSGWSQAIFIKPSIGINFSDMNYSKHGDEYSAKAGITAGVSASFGNRGYIEPGLFFVQKNTSYSIRSFDSGFPAPDKGTFHLSGIQIPLAIGYRLISNASSNRPFGLRIFGGGSALLLRSTDQTANFKRSQWGVFAGSGVDLAFLFLDVKYDWSLTEMQKTAEYFNLGKLRSLYINLGVRFPLPGKQRENFASL